MKKRTKLITAAVALGALLTVGGTLAWFTDTEVATNVVTVGNVDIAIYEKGGDTTNYKKINKAEEGVNFGVETPIVPNQELDKQPKIKNEGANAAFVRAFVEFKYYEVTKDAEGKDVKTLVTSAPNGGADPVIVAADGWEYDESEKCYYYVGTGDAADKDILKSGAETGDIFDKVTIPSTWTNAMTNYSVDIIVKAEAVQSDNVKKADGATVTTAKDAFEVVGAANVVDFETTAAATTE